MNKYFKTKQHENTEDVLDLFCKVMDINPTKHMVFFLCIDYTIWPGGQQIIEDCQKKKKKKTV